jgi:hypothetical protein
VPVLRSIRHWTCPRNVLWDFWQAAERRLPIAEASGVMWVARNGDRLEAYSYLGPLTARGVCGMEGKRLTEK